MSQTIERPINPGESAVVSWLLQHAPMRGTVSHLAPLVADLRVVDACSCGCPGVDFARDGQASPWRPIADASGTTPEGVAVGVILWGGKNEITGLEVYSEAGVPVFTLPAVEQMKTWEKP
jgi:hypothetical protein